MQMIFITRLSGIRLKQIDMFFVQTCATKCGRLAASMVENYRDLHPVSSKSGLLHFASYIIISLISPILAVYISNLTHIHFLKFENLETCSVIKMEKTRAGKRWRTV